MFYYTTDIEHAQRIGLKGIDLMVYSCLSFLCKNGTWHGNYTKLSQRSMCGSVGKTTRSVESLVRKGLIVLDHAEGQKTLTIRINLNPTQTMKNQEQQVEQSPLSASGAAGSSQSELVLKMQEEMLRMQEKMASLQAELLQYRSGEQSSSEAEQAICQNEESASGGENVICQDEKSICQDEKSICQDEKSICQDEGCTKESNKEKYNKYINKQERSSSNTLKGEEQAPTTYFENNYSSAAVVGKKAALGQHVLSADEWLSLYGMTEKFAHQHVQCRTLYNQLSPEDQQRVCKHTYCFKVLNSRADKPKQPLFYLKDEVWKECAPEMRLKLSGYETYRAELNGECVVSAMVKDADGQWLWINMLEEDAYMLGLEYRVCMNNSRHGVEHCTAHFMTRDQMPNEADVDFTKIVREHRMKQNQIV